MEPDDNPTNGGDDAAVQFRRGGLTPFRIVMSILLIGVVWSVAVVSLDRFVTTGRKSACDLSADAASIAIHIYFATNANTYPINFTELTAERIDTTGAETAAIPAALLLPANVALNVVATVPPAPAAQAYMQLSSGSSWYLTMALVSGGAPTFTCSP